jgi:hypothetical protein
MLPPAKLNAGQGNDRDDNHQNGAFFITRRPEPRSRRQKPTEKNNGDDKNGHREKNTQSHDVTPEAKNMTCPATKPLSRRIATAYRKTSLSYWISPPGFNQYSERNPAAGTFYPDT